MPIHTHKVPVVTSAHTFAARPYLTRDRGPRLQGLSGAVGSDSRGVEGIPVRGGDDSAAPERMESTKENVTVLWRFCAASLTLSPRRGNPEFGVVRRGGMTWESVENDPGRRDDGS